MQHKISSSFRGSLTAAPKLFGKISICARKHSASKIFTCERLVMAIDLDRQRLFFRPRLRHVLNAWLADVTDQHKRQSICVWPAKFVNTRASARLWTRPGSAGLLNCDAISCDRIGAPDLCLRPGSGH